MKRKTAGCYCILAAALAVGCEGKSRAPAPQAEAPAAVQTVHPSRGEITRFATLLGEVHPYQTATLYAKVPGYLKTLSVDKGDRVKEGDLIAVIEVPELVADELKYLAELKVAALDDRRLSESRAKAPDLVVPLTADEAHGRLEVAQANLDRVRTLLRFSRITAPFGGLITTRSVDPGAFIPAATSGSAAANAAIVTLMDFNTVRVQVALPEMEVSHLTTNEPVQISSEALPGRRFDGRVTRFSYALDPVTKTMLTEIDLPNPKLELRPGMLVSARIGLERNPDALLIPAGALVTEKAGTSVFKLAGGKAKKTTVKTGFSDGVNVEIKEGASAEDELILPGGRTLRDGQAVVVGEAK